MGDERSKPHPRCWDENKDRFRRSKRHETRIAKKLGGKRLPRSGGMPWSRWDTKTAGGDVTIPEFHLEHKRTEKGSMAVKLDWLQKVSMAARCCSKEPGLIVTFEKGLQKPEDWILIPLATFQRLLERNDGSPGRTEAAEGIPSR